MRLIGQMLSLVLACVCLAQGEEEMVLLEQKPGGGAAGWSYAAAAPDQTWSVNDSNQPRDYVTPAQSGTATKVRIHVADNNGASGKLAVYSSDGSTLLAQATFDFGIFSAGWNDVTLTSSFAATGGTQYLIALWPSPAFALSYSAGGSGRIYNCGVNSVCCYVDAPCTPVPTGTAQTVSFGLGLYVQ
jgi:hypothetical protein